MATTSLQNESARATGAAPSLHSAGIDLEMLAGDAAELAALIDMLADSSDIDERANKALRACSTLAHRLATSAGECSGKFIAAARA